MTCREGQGLLHDVSCRYCYETVLTFICKFRNTCWLASSYEYYLRFHDASWAEVEILTYLLIKWINSGYVLSLGKVNLIARKETGWGWKPSKVYFSCMKPPKSFHQKVRLLFCYHIWLTINEKGFENLGQGVFWVKHTWPISKITSFNQTDLSILPHLFLSYTVNISVTTPTCLFNSFIYVFDTLGARLYIWQNFEQKGAFGEVDASIERLSLSSFSIMHLTYRLQKCTRRQACNDHDFSCFGFKERAVNSGNLVTIKVFLGFRRIVIERFEHEFEA